LSALTHDDANLQHTDRFVFRLIHEGDSGVSLDDLPQSYREILEDMGGSLHDAIGEPSVAENFASTPEQLPQRVRLLD
jgi:hypothetical protein